MGEGWEREGEGGERVGEGWERVGEGGRGLGKSETVGPCRGVDSGAHFGALQFCDGVVKFHKIRL